MINFKCIACGHVLHIKEYFAGCKVQCPGCKSELTTPGGDPGQNQPPEVTLAHEVPTPPAAKPSRPKPPALPPLDDPRRRDDDSRRGDDGPRRRDDEPMVAIPGLLEGASAAHAIPVSLPSAARDGATATAEAKPSANNDEDLPVLAPLPASTSRPEPHPPSLPAARGTPTSDKRSWMDSSPSWPDLKKSTASRSTPPRLPTEGIEYSRQAETSGKALGALVLGLATFIVPVLCAIPAIILASLALVDIRRRRGGLEGRGLAITAIVLALIGNVTLIPFWMVKKQMDYSRNEVRVKKNLEEISKALLRYHDRHGTFPEALAKNAKGQPTLSWRVQLLPFLSHEALYKEFRLDEPWDSPHNRALLSRMPPVFASESRYSGADLYTTHFRVFVGPDALFKEGSKTRKSDIYDPHTPTILVAEARDAVFWTKPEELNYRDMHIPLLGASSRGGFYAGTLEGLHPIVHFFDKRLDNGNIHAAINPRDGRPVHLDVDGKAHHDHGKVLHWRDKDVRLDKGFPEPVWEKAKW